MSYVVKNTIPQTAGVRCVLERERQARVHVGVKAVQLRYRDPVYMRPSPQNGRKIVFYVVKNTLLPFAGVRFYVGAETVLLRYRTPAYMRPSPKNGKKNRVL